MEYKGYEIEETKNAIIIRKVKDFNPVHTFECGQCFRWKREKDGSYTGVVRGRAVNVEFHGDKEEAGALVIKNGSIDDFINIWYDYFDLGRDYGAIKQSLMKDNIMREAVKFGYGIRLLKQDIWETLISFILSANNRIPMIMRAVEKLSEAYGEEIKLDGVSYYSFPSVDKLAASNCEELDVCKGGFRCKYILSTSQMIRDGDVRLERLETMSRDKARNELMRLPGVGPKVADCVLLYSGTKYDVFPTDVWVKRVMEELYFKREASFKEIWNFANENFGDMAGFAQQYLFYYARENKIGAKENSLG